MPKFNFYANSANTPVHGDVYTKNGKAYSINKDLDLIGVRTGKAWGSVASVSEDYPANPRLLVISGGVAV